MVLLLPFQKGIGVGLLVENVGEFLAGEVEAIFLSTLKLPI